MFMTQITNQKFMLYNIETMTGWTI